MQQGLGAVLLEDLAVQPLIARIAAGGVEEVILALPATVDGATTAHYLTDRLRPLGVPVTRLAASRWNGISFSVAASMMMSSNFW